VVPIENPLKKEQFLEGKKSLGELRGSWIAYLRKGGRRKNPLRRGGLQYRHEIPPGAWGGAVTKKRSGGQEGGLFVVS